MGTAAKYIAALGVALAAAAALAGAVGARHWGWHAYEASGIAAVLNWVAGSMALVTVVATRNSSQRINGALLAIIARMALPMAAVAYLTQSHHPLAGYGLGGFIVIHYLIGLIIETIMTVRLVSQASATSSQSGPQLGSHQAAPGQLAGPIET